MEKEHFEILLEHIENKLDLVVEGHQVLDKKIDDRFSVLDRKISDNRDFMRAMNKDINRKIDNLNIKLDETADRLDKKIDSLKKELKEDIKKVENKVDTINTAFINHEERITAMERVVHN
ncbi:hypothetical protein JXL19_01610 [bacterium]|nr:hypothetical protein [bacterium]